MPSRHIVKQVVPDNFYHVYNRGVAKQDIFRDAADYATFLNLLKRHLDPEVVTDRFGRPIAKLHENIELLAFCLMPNHYHLLVYNKTEQGLPDLMRRVMTAYSMSFNKRHKRVGALFQNTYKASMIIDDGHFWHISRYIHLNPQDIHQDYTTYPFSSYPYYIGQKSANWLRPEKILALHNGDTGDYQTFLRDYEAVREDIQLLKHSLADL